MKKEEDLISRKPRTIFAIDVGSVCNNKCVFCADGEHKKNIIPKEIIKKQIVKNKDLKKLHIVYSESTLNPYIFEYIKLAKEVGYETIGVSTNGRMLAYKNFAEKLIENGMNEITVSIHGHTKRIHEASTRTPESFVQVEKCLINLSKIKERVKFNFIVATTVSKFNVNNLLEICTFLNQFRIDAHILNFIEPRGFAYDKYKILAPKLTDYVNNISKVKKALPNYELVVTEVPFCVMGEYRNLQGIKEKEIVSGEKEQPKKRVRNLIYDKLEFCNQCIYDPYCKGIWKKYLEIFGENEFYAIINEKTIKQSNLNILKNDKKNEVFKSNYLNYKEDKNIEKSLITIDDEVISLESKIDFNFYNKIIQQIKNINLNKNILLIINPFRSYTPLIIHWFFENVNFTQFDVYIDESKKNKLSKEIKSVSKKYILDSTYDYIISYGALDFLDNNILNGKKLVIFSQADIYYLMDKEFNEKNFNILFKDESDNLTFYNLFKYNFSKTMVGSLSNKISLKYSIGLPPDINLFFENPSNNKIFDFIFLGGKDRNYKFLYENRDLFDGKKVLITNKLDCKESESIKYIKLLEENKNFITLSHVSNEIYAKLLLNSRICLTFFKGIHNADYTSLSDAMWYGLPIITNPIFTYNHIKEEFIFVSNRNELILALKKIENKYVEKSLIVKKYARSNINVFDLLFKICNDLK
ncbi:radical SAM protein [archaeon]|jgi:MoaA/NifB/PqqE/SkfB family radical SAM enzyme|nr:radical SAM protein [Candidatus Woesearchaeota archaeon]MBT3465165.1 radical SAM protein [archaeon]MBT4351667.1 radical SAM protein [archaeon]MBT4647489.1 radical SAM protein [archaeon]MBT6822014.1 radical SAM protein [archaeon]